MKSSHNFRYEQTLRINFDKPIGIGSFGFETDDELLKFVNEYPHEDHNFDTFKKCQKLKNQINNIIVESFETCKNVELSLDWRDDFEIEIHGINPDMFNDNMIQEMDSKIEKLFKETEI